MSALLSDGEVIEVKGKESNESGVSRERLREAVSYKYTLSIPYIYFTRLHSSVKIAESNPNGGINHFNRHNHPASRYNRRANPST